MLLSELFLTTNKPLNRLTILSRLSFQKLQRDRWLKLGAVLLLLIGGTTFWRVVSSQPSDRDLISFTVEAEKGSLPGLITASGELEARRSVNVSPDKQGLLKVVFVAEGEKVIEGQLLAKMEGGDYQYRLDELKADYEKNEAAYERREELFIEGAISDEERDDYKNRFLKSKARLKQREVEGEELNIRAPFAGQITALYAEPGSFVTPTTRASSTAGSTSTSVVELSQGLEVSAKVPESDIGRILIGQLSSVRVDAFPEKRFQAKVIEIAPRAIKTDNVTSFEVKLNFVEETPLLRIGMTVDVDFQTGETDVSTLVPTVAIVTENGQPGLLLIGQNKQPRFQKVELGTSSGSKTAIIEGVNPGTRVFIDLPPWAKRKRD